MRIVDFGLTPYREMWEAQKRIQKQLIESKKSFKGITSECILVGEHPAVYTLGKHGKEQNLLLDKTKLADHGCECIKIERGGDITYHGPGQVIVYPIIDLPSHSLGVKKYVELLEESVIRLLKEYGIKSERIAGATGVWLDKDTPNERKICAIGIKISHGVTMHGFALNVNTDLNGFRAINPCGFIDKGVTSMEKELKKNLEMSVIKKRLVEILVEIIES